MMTKKTRVLVIGQLLLLLALGVCFNNLYAQTQVSNAAELNAVRNTLGGNFIQTANINLTAYPNWEAIGNATSPFTGSYNGNGFTITGLSINRATESNVGLFGQTSGATIQNVTLSNVSVTGSGNVGGLVGNNNTTTISNSSVSGSINGSVNYVGGLIGRNNSSEITECNTSVTITVSTTSTDPQIIGVGGLIGGNLNSSIVQDCYATGSSNTTMIDSVGGLVGMNGMDTGNTGPRVVACYATGSITGTGSRLGGLVGTNYSTTAATNRSTVSESYSNVTMTFGTHQGHTSGGFVGRNENGIITTSYSLGNVTGQSHDGGPFNTGGFVGRNCNNGVISNCFSRSNVSGAERVGGFAGDNYIDNETGTSASIINCFSTGNVTTSLAEGIVGGFLGRQGESATTTASYWNTLTSGQAASAAGEGRTTNQMTYPYENSYTGWDFNNTWQADTNNEYNAGYPFFLWQLVPPLPPATNLTAVVQGESVVLNWVAPEPIERDLLGYKVFRFVSQNQQNPNLWNELTTIDSPTTLTYTDVTWAGLAPMNYGYAVRASYTDNNFSDPVISELLENTFNSVVTINISTDTAVPPTGALVTLTNQNNDPEFVYNMTATSTGVVTFNLVRRGTYRIQAQLEGFSNYSVTDMLIDTASFNHNLVLVTPPPEMPPTNVVAEVLNEDEVLITWDAPDRNYIGYAVYRLLEQNQSYPATWTFLTEIETTETTEYTDTEWSNINQGVYCYAVTTVYPEEIESEAAFSNSLPNNMTADIIANVSTNSGDPVTGAQVTFTNNSGNPEHIYSFIATEDGVTEIADVWKGTYTVTARLTGFHNFTANNVLINDNPFTYNLVLVENKQPIVGLEYEIHNGNNVELNWLPPGTSLQNEQWISWDYGHFYGAYGIGTPLEFTAAIRFTQEELEELNIIGLNITSIRFWPNVLDASYTLKVWKNGSANPWNPGNEVYSQAVTEFNYGNWNTIELNTPVEIEGDGELWMGYHVNTTTGYPAGFDFGPAQDGYGNLLYREGTWSTLLEAHTGFNYNWLIKGFAGFPTMTQSVELSKNRVQEAPRNTQSRAFVGYKVLRNQTVIANNVQNLTYMDSNVPFGTYTYKVVAVYTSGDSEAEEVGPVVILNVEDDTVSKFNTKLIGNYPNPFNPETNIKFSLKDDSVVFIDVFNIKGQKIKTLLSGDQTQGEHTISWNGKDDDNKEVASGIYFYRLKTDNYTETKKLILMK